MIPSNALTGYASAMDDEFYQALEGRFRGSRADVKARFGAYMSFLQPLLDMQPNASALDLGCGRGEWLELLNEAGFEVRGIDTDRLAVEQCQALGFAAAVDDALLALRAESADSLDVISAFHVVEHLPFDHLRSLVAEAYRVMRPGGLLILETPNPENLLVGASSFYLDPTHRNPIPPLLLEFIADYQGFERVTIVRLQEQDSLKGVVPPKLIDVLAGVSPDYAIVAQKAAQASESVTRSEAQIAAQARLTHAFERRYGLTLSDLAFRFQEPVDAIPRLHAEGEERKLDVARLEVAIAQLSDEQDVIKSQFDEQLQQLTAELVELTAQRDAMSASLSWRITAPLRWLAGKLTGQ